MINDIKYFLLMHGPLVSKGSNFVAQRFQSSSGELLKYNPEFHCGQNIVSMARAFKRNGFGVAYSGWVEDEEWLLLHEDEFDCLTISEQSNLKDYSFFGDIRVQNNKEKIYLSCERGLSDIRSKFGDDLVVIRQRSDISYNPIFLLNESKKVREKSIHIEYIDMNSKLSVPDFMSMGKVDILHSIYKMLLMNSLNGNSFHPSSHVDHCMCYISLMNQGAIDNVLCMDKSIYDSMIWRGVPKYLESMLFPNFDSSFAFDCEVKFR